MTASSVGHVPTGTRPPCVLVLLGFRRPCTNELTDGTTSLKVVVLGGGSSGEHFVGALRRLDGESELTLVERQLVGGECSYWACMPTKTMLRTPELAAATRRAPGIGRPAELDVQRVLTWRD